MKVERREGSVEKQILAGLIISPEVLRELETVWQPELFSTPFARTIATWCYEHWNQYKTAPGRLITDIFHSKSREENFDGTQEELIQDFLEEVNREHEEGDKFNAAYLLDKAERYFKKQSLTHLAEDIQACLSGGEIGEAETLLTEYRLVERPKADGVDPFTNADLIKESFEEVVDPLFTFPGALGDMINGALTRDSFIGIQGPEKRGKTWWLMEFGIRAFRSRCNVAFFQVGDMSEKQMVRRLHIRLAGRSHLPKYCGEILVPVMDCSKNQDGSCRIPERLGEGMVLIKRDDEGEAETLSWEEADKMGYRPCDYCRKEDSSQFRGAVWHKKEIVEPLTWGEASKIGAQFMKRGGGKNFKLVTYPNDSVNIRDLSAHLDRWEAYEGFVPDVVIIDYADILAPEPGAKEPRHQENARWKAMRRLSQERHCCVVTATQADADSYETVTQSLRNFSEDKRKYSHVTAMLALNQTSEEKKRGIMRISQLVVRDDEFDVRQTVSVLTCLKKGRPYLDSFLTYCSV